MRIATVFLAIMAVAAAPAAADEFYGVTTGDQLVRFDSIDPAFRDALPITGLAAGEHVIALDVRPTSGGLYGVALKDFVVRVVRIDQTTGAVTPLSAGRDVGPVTGAGMDIHPNGATADVATNNGTALRYNLTTGAGSVLPTPSGNPVVGLAWAPSGSPTSLGIRVTSNDLVLYAAGDASTNGTVHALGITVLPQDEIDYAPDGTLWMYASTGGPDLWRVNILDFPDPLYPLEADLRAFCVKGSGPAAFAAPSFGAAEGDGAATVTIRRDAPYDGPGKVAWSTADGTATAGQDYTASGGEVTFARNQATANVTIPILQDSAVEGAERFALKLTSVEGVGAGPDATVQIADDDTPATPPGGGGGGAPSGGGGGGSGGGTGPAPDTSAPVVLALPLSAKVGKKLSLPFGVSEAARTTFTLQLSAKDAKRLKLKRTVGTVTLSARLGVNKAVLGLAKKTVAALKRGKKLVLTGVLTATDAAGNRRSVTVKITLKR